jgi:excisionase family DNA binding protein
MNAILMSHPEAAEALGISERKLAQLRERNEIPVVRIGRRVLYRRPALEEWAEHRESAPSAPDLAEGAGT